MNMWTELRCALGADHSMTSEGVGVEGISIFEM